jgi:hypothetical protein
MAMVRRDDRVSVLTLQEQIAALIARGPHSSFALTIGIGLAGERVARQVHAQAGWFPAIRRVDLTREEDARGGYAVVSPTGVSLAGQLAAVEMATPMAIVDDTIFSGITMRQVLEALSPAVRARAHAFCCAASRNRSRRCKRSVPSRRASPRPAACSMRSASSTPAASSAAAPSPHRPGSARVLRAARVDTRVVPRPRRRRDRSLSPPQSPARADRRSLAAR